MRSWKFIVVVITVGSLVGGGYRFATRPNSISRVQAPAPPIRTVQPSEPPVAAETVAPQETAASQAPPPAMAIAPAAPKPRSEASLAASRRDFTNPLVISYPPSTPPPRRASAAEPEVAADFDKIALMLRDYRSLTGENPVGTNAEIMKAIMGGNPKGAQLGPPEGQHLNENGELIDRWGTPYFFHQLSKDVMEIRSAGPDRRLWNDDDIVSD